MGGVAHAVAEDVGRESDIAELREMNYVSIIRLSRVSLLRHARHCACPTIGRAGSATMQPDDATMTALGMKPTAKSAGGNTTQGSQ